MRTPGRVFPRLSTGTCPSAHSFRALSDYAGKNGHLVASGHVEESESGRIADRPQFRRMLDEADEPSLLFQEFCYNLRRVT